MEFFVYDSLSSSSSSSSSGVYPTFSHSLELSSVPAKRKAGRKKFKETRHPVYRGVRRRNGNKWVCEVREPNKKSRIWVGTFSSPELAARAHDVAALSLKGDLATLNFADSASALPRAKSSSPRDIRAAALEAANAFIPSPPRNPNFPVSSSSSQLCSHDEDEVKPILFLDEEALFNMPVLLDSMAEGLLLTPPAITMAFDWDDDLDISMDLNLWKWI